MTQPPPTKPWSSPSASTSALAPALAAVAATVRMTVASTKGVRWKVPGSPGGRGGLEYLGDGVDAYRRIYEIKTKDSAEPWQTLIGLQVSRAHRERSSRRHEEDLKL